MCVGCVMVRCGAGGGCVAVVVVFEVLCDMAVSGVLDKSSTPASAQPDFTFLRCAQLILKCGSSCWAGLRVRTLFTLDVLL